MWGDATRYVIYCVCVSVCVPLQLWCESDTPVNKITIDFHRWNSSEIRLLSLFNIFFHGITRYAQFTVFEFNCLFFARYLTLSLARLPSRTEEEARKEHTQTYRTIVHVTRLMLNVRGNLYETKSQDVSNVWRSDRLLVNVKGCARYNALSVVSLFSLFSLYGQVSNQEQATSWIHHFIITKESGKNRV